MEFRLFFPLFLGINQVGDQQGRVEVATDNPTFFLNLKARREEQIKAAHDEAIFGALHPPAPHEETIFGTSSHPPFSDRDDETEAKSVETSTTENAPLTSLISDQVRENNYRTSCYQTLLQLGGHCFSYLIHVQVSGFSCFL